MQNLCDEIHSCTGMPINLLSLSKTRVCVVTRFSSRILNDITSYH